MGRKGQGREDRYEAVRSSAYILMPVLCLKISNGEVGRSL